MKEDHASVVMIPTAEITVLNPRARNRRVFNELVTSISRLGLKKPITVSRSLPTPGYLLVCGQGRLEAFLTLGQVEIPAIIIDASEEDCFVMSLVENIARRQHSSVELMREIGALRVRGYSMAEIAAKIDFSVEYVSAILLLLDHGEDRLIRGVERGVIPYSVALEIARAKEADVQLALAEAYEKKTIPGNQIIAIRRIIDQRNNNGRGLSGSRNTKPKRQVTADALIRTYRRETDRQKLLVKRATLAQSRLIFVVNALRRLLSDEHFSTLLRAEDMHTLPRPLADRIQNA